MTARSEAHSKGNHDRAEMQVSFVLATHNRRDVLMQTLDRVESCGLERGQFEIIVVDNASADGTATAVSSRVDRLLRLRRNLGSCAKALGVNHATGRYVVFLDDDAWPRPGSVERMVQHFEDDSELGAAGFTIHLPSGLLEGAALPDVFVGCGVGFRAEALRTAGNLDASFFMQAEEYDLSFRMAAAGWRVRVFDDLHVEHRKSEQSRNAGAAMFYDVRNNLRVAARYLPDSHYSIYRHYWAERYRWLAERAACLEAWKRGVRAARRRCPWERLRFRSRRLSAVLLERLFGWREVEEAMRMLWVSGVRRVVFAGFGKNLFAFHRGAEQLGLTVVAIGDNRFAAPGRVFRGVPVVPIPEALKEAADGVVISDMSPVHAATMREQVKCQTAIPVHDWFGRIERIRVAQPQALNSTAESSDEQPVGPITACCGD